MKRIVTPLSLFFFFILFTSTSIFGQTYTTTWLDNNGDGDIDQVRLNFSEAVTFSDVSGAGDIFDAITISGGITLISSAANEIDFATLIGVNSYTFDITGATGTADPGVDVTYVAAATNNSIIGDVSTMEIVDATVETASEDAASPVILSAVTDDTGGAAGQIDRIVVTFSESIEATDVDPDDTGNTAGETDDFIVAGYAISGVVPSGGVGVDGNQLFINLTESGGNDTGATPNVTLNASQLNDLVVSTPNAATAYSAAATDGVAPILISTVTNDNNGNGQIDQIIVTYSETMEADDVDADDTGNTAGQTDDFIVTGYAIAGVAPSGGAGVDGNQIVITLTESGSPDTDATPNLEIIVGQLNDLAMNGNAASSAAVADAANPVIVSAVTDDTGGAAGQIDRIVVTFSESIEATDVDPDDTGNTAGETDDFIVAGYAISGVVPSGGVGVDGNQLFINLTESGGNDTGATPNVTLNASQLNDLVVSTPNAATAYSAAATDGVAPILISTVTNDNNGNGQIDQIIVTYSETMEADDVDADDTGNTAGQTDDFIVTGYAIAGVAPSGGAGVDGNQIVITLTESGSPDTDATPNLEIIVGQLNDLAMNGNAASSAAVADAANPVIVSAVTDDTGGAAGQIDRIVVTFSESIEATDVDPDDTGNTAGETDDFIVAGYAISGVVPSGGVGVDGNQLFINLTESGGNDTGATPNVTLNASQLNDLVVSTPNAATAYSAAATDGVAPILISTVTNDNNGNGQIDQIIVTYSETMEADDVDADDTGNTAGQTDDFIVTGYAIAGVAPSGGAGVDGNQIVITLTESGSPDTDATPNLQIIVGQLNDLAMNGNAASSAAVTDAANPVIVSAVTDDTGGAAGQIDRIVVTFSESIEATDVDPDDTGNTAGETDDFIVAGYAISGVVPSGGVGVDGNQLFINLTESGGNDTGATPNVTLNASQLNDLVVSTPNAATAYSAAATDGVAPILISTVTNDNNGNGQIDQIIVTYSETMEADDVDADDTGNTAGQTDDFIVTGYAIAGVAPSGGAGVDGNQIVITLTESGSPDTDATPNLEIIVGQLNDLAMNGNAASSAAVADAANPVIVSAVTDDTGGAAGQIDRIVVTFSESIEATDVDPDDTGNTAGETDDFIVAGYAISGVVPSGGVGVDGNQLFINLTESGGNDTGATPNVTLNASQLNDLVVSTPNAATAYSAAATDGVAPILISTVTNDNNGNGQIDQIIVTYSETMEADDVDADDTGNTAGQTDDFIVTGYAIAGVAPSGGAGVDGNQIVITLTESGSPDTDATPNLQIIVGQLNDLAMNGNAASSAAVTDAANPVIVSAVTDDTGGAAGQIDRIVVTFSESIEATDVDPDDTGNTAGETDDFIVAGYAISGVVPSGGVGVDGNQLFINLTESGGNDTGATPNVTLNASQLNDLVVSTPNAATAYSAAATDGVAPILISTVTNDNNGNGQIDQIIVTYSETMEADDVDADDTGNTAGQTDDFIVTGYAIAGVAPSGGAGVDGNQIVITLTESGSPDTDATPNLQIIVGQLNDLAMNGNAASSAAVTDAANPVIVSAVTDDTGGAAGQIDRIVVTFSESIEATDVDPDDTGNTAGETDDFIVAGYAISGVVPSGGVGVDGNQLFINLTESGNPDTGVTPNVTLNASQLNDLVVSTPNAATAYSAAATDGALPVIIDQLINSSNAYFQLVFSEEIFAVDGTIDPTDFDITINNGAATVSVTNVLDLLGNGSLTSEDTLRFSLNVTPNALSPDGSENVTISTNGTTIDDAADNLLANSETSATVNLNVNTDQVTVTGATYTELAANQGYIEFTFSEGLLSGDAGTARIANSTDGVIETGNWTDGSADSPQTDDVNFQYAHNGSSARIRNNNDTDIRWTDNTGTRIDYPSSYTGTVFRLYLNDILSGPFEGVETYTLSAVDGRISGRTTGGPMLASYSFVFTLPDLTAENFTAATATAYDVNGDGNIDEVEVVMPDGVEDATVVPAEFQFNSIAASGFDTGTTPNDNTFRLLFDSYTGTAVIGNLVYAAGTMEDDAEVNAPYLASGNAVNGGSIVPTDAAGPVILSAITADNDLNGQIDRITVTFSETFNDIDIDDGDFNLSDGYTIPAAGFSVSSPDVTLTLNESGAADTDQVPNVIILPGGAGMLQDQSAGNAPNPAQTFTNTSDGAAPYIQVNSSSGNATPDFSGTIDDPTATVIISVDGQTRSTAPAIQNNGDGTWSYTSASDGAPITLGAGLGFYEVTVIGIDNSGNNRTDVTSLEYELTGGANITPATPATLCESDDFQALGQIVIDESGNGDFSAGTNVTLLLTLPAGFEFDPNTDANFGASSLSDISAISSVFVGTASLQITMTVTGTAGDDIVRIDDLLVKVVTGGSSGNLVRAGGTLSLLTNDTNYATMTSNPEPSSIMSLDETVGGDNDITELQVLASTAFTLDATDQTPSTLRWYENVVDGSPEFTGTMATQANLNSSEGLHSYFLANFDGTCEGVPTLFNILVYTYADNGTNDFSSRNFRATDDPDTMTFSNPANHIVSVSGTGIVANISEAGTLKAVFDPSVGEGTYNITYSVENSLGEISTITGTFVVEALSDLIQEFRRNTIADAAPGEDYCETDILSFDADLAEVSSIAPAYFFRFSYLKTAGPGPSTTFPIAFPAVGGASYPADPNQNNGAGIPAAFPLVGHNPNANWDLDLSTLTPGATYDVYIEYNRIGVGTRGQRRVFSFTVQALPTVTIPALAGFCENDNTTFQLEATVDGVTGPMTNGFELEFFNGATYVPEASYPDENFNPFNLQISQGGSGPGTYRITYTSLPQGAGGCTNVATATFTLFPTPNEPFLNPNHNNNWRGAPWVDTGDVENGFNSYVMEFCSVADLSFFVGENSGTLYNWYAADGTTLLQGNQWFISTAVAFDDPTTGGVTEVPTAGTTNTFYFATTENGCESALKKITVYIYEDTDLPVPDATYLSTHGTQINTTRYVFDYCDAFVSIELDPLSATPGNPVSRNPSSRYNLYDATRTYISTINTSTITAADISLGAGNQNATFFVSQIWNDQTPGAAATALLPFEGCESELVQMDINVTVTPTNVTVADFDAGTLQYHVAEGATLGDITHASGLVEKYIWYNDPTPTGQVGPDILEGDDMLETTLNGDGFDPSSVTTPFTNDVYDYYVTRLSGENAETGYVGCESAVPTNVQITVHAIQRQPIVASDNTNSMISTTPFTDLGTSPTGMTHWFSVCVDQLESDIQLSATETGYMGASREFRWYSVDASQVRLSQTPLAITNAPTFNQLQIASLSPSLTISRFFEVVQITDTDVFAGTESNSGYVQIDISPQDALEFRDNGTGLTFGDSFCRDDATGNIVVDLYAGGASAGAANVDYEIVSYLTNTSTTPYVKSGTIVHSASASYTVGEIITGGTSGQTAEVLSDDGTTMTITNVSGNFALTETITGGMSGIMSTVTSVSSSIAGNPTLDFTTLHDNVPGSQLIGGDPTVHVITMSYNDPVTLCAGIVSKTVTIHPDPDITFFVNGVDIAAFVTGDDQFCYEAGNIIMQGALPDGTPLTTGTFESTIMGGMPIAPIVTSITTINGSASFNPINEHNAFHTAQNTIGGPVTGTDGKFLNQSTILITYRYTDGNGCDNSVSRTLYVNPEPEVIEVTGLPGADLAASRSSNNIRLTNFCADATAVDLEIQFIDPVDPDPGSMEEDDYNVTGSEYVFDWNINGNVFNVVGDNTLNYTLGVAETNLVVSVTVTDVNGCTETFNETHTLQTLPSLNITGITDNQSFCADETNPTLGLTDATVDGIPATNTVAAADIVSWSVDSYNLADGALAAVQIASGASSIPTVDLDAWHTSMLLTTPGTLVGGNPTYHMISITYRDPSREYQGTATMCTNTVVETIIVNPDPDISIEVAGNDISAFATGDDQFCYEDGNIVLQGVLADGTPLTSGTFTSSVTGVITTNNGVALFNAQEQHNAYHTIQNTIGGPVTGNAGKFLNQSMITVTYAYTDGNGCDNSINTTLFVNPEPEVLAVTGLPPADLANARPSNFIRLTNFCADAAAVDLEIQFIDPLDPDPGSIEEDDYNVTGSEYRFDWTINGNVFNQVGVNTLNYTLGAGETNLVISVAVTDVNGCTETFNEIHALQNLPSLDITGVTDNQAFCVDAMNPTLGLTDATLNGNLVTNAVAVADILNWTVSSYNQADGAGAAVPIATGTGSLPAVDLDAWHTDPALTTPGTLIGGNATFHMISITYQDPSRDYQGIATMCSNTITETIVVNPNPDLSITIDGTDANNLQFCHDDLNIVIEGIDAASSSAIGGGSFTIDGAPVSSANGRAVINASTYHGADPFAAQSTHTIEYSYTDANGCSNTFTRDFLVNPRPEFVTGVIQTASTCATSSVELFVDMTDGVSNYTFTWFANGVEVDGINEIDEDGNLNDERLTYDFAGQLTVNFGVTATYNGPAYTTMCQASIQNQSITVGAEPVPAVSWVGITAGNPNGTDFTITEDNPTLPDSDVDLVRVNIDGVEVQNVPNPTFPFNFTHFFTTPGVHTIQVEMSTTAGCSVNPARNVRIVPHYTTYNASNSYSETFETAASFDLTAVQGGWLIDSLSLDGKVYYDTATSWVRGSGALIPGTASSIDGTGAVITARGGAAGYNESEVSFVYSPSFDLSGFTSPTVSFLRYEDFETFRDGAVFQVSVDDGRTWETVGTFNPALEAQGLASTPGWYNREAISSSPGSVAPGSATAVNTAQVGWALNSDWQEAISPIAIDPVQDDYVRFRFALSAQAGTKTTNGFGFDLVRIYERNQIVLVETFSSTLSPNSKILNDTVDIRPQYAGTDILKINYFTDLANGDVVDQINERNVTDPGAKVAFYGVGDVPSIAIAGDANTLKTELVNGQLELVASEFSFLNAKLANARLNNPAFDVSVTASVDGDGNLVVNADYTATTVFGALQEVTLMVAVVEPTVTLPTALSPIYPAGTTVENVLRTLLPSAAGQYEAGPIAIGETRSLTNLSWTISNMYDPATVRVIAYVQDLNSKLVYQAASLDVATGLTNSVLGLEDLSDFKIYPNPADQEVTIEFADGLAEDKEWIIFDQTGREVLKGEIERGTQTLTVETSDLPSGLYFINLYGEGQERVTKRVMVLH